MVAVKGETKMSSYRNPSNINRRFYVQDVHLFAPGDLVEWHTVQIRDLRTNEAELELAPSEALALAEDLIHAARECLRCLEAKERRKI
jgi:hypothetical protein